MLHKFANNLLFKGSKRKRIWSLAALTDRSVCVCGGGGLKSSSRLRLFYKKINQLVPVQRIKHDVITSLDESNLCSDGCNKDRQNSSGNKTICLLEEYLRGWKAEHGFVFLFHNLSVALCPSAPLTLVPPLLCISFVIFLQVLLSVT